MWSRRFPNLIVFRPKLPVASRRRRLASSEGISKTMIVPAGYVLWLDSKKSYYRIPHRRWRHRRATPNPGSIVYSRYRTPAFIRLFVFHDSNNKKLAMIRFPPIPTKRSWQRVSPAAETFEKENGEDSLFCCCCWHTTNQQSGTIRFEPKNDIQCCFVLPLLCCLE